ncbi:MAG: electron transport complex subunit E [Ruminococcaceae bacterium]|nr:electron transport complex subunit E [Oscillospiraceae bacterium]
MSSNKKLAIFLKGLIAENPVLVLVLGTCPTLAQTGSVIAALSMGIAATVVLLCSNMVISALRNIIPDTVRIPCYIVVIAGFVTVVQLVMHAYLPDLYDMMGVYLALIVVNCIILGRAEMYARKNGVIDSALDGLGMGIGFLIALVAMATVREVLGAGSFAGIAIPFLKNYKIPFFTQAPGGFFVFGVLIAIVNKIGPKAGSEKRKNFSCEGCPSASVCSKASCSGECEGKEA